MQYSCFFHLQCYHFRTSFVSSSARESEIINWRPWSFQQHTFKWFIPLNISESIYVAEWQYLGSRTTSEVHVRAQNMNMHTISFGTQTMVLSRLIFSTQTTNISMRNLLITLLPCFWKIRYLFAQPGNSVQVCRFIWSHFHLINCEVSMDFFYSIFTAASKQTKWKYFCLFLLLH